MQSIAALLAALILAGCITAWEQPPDGIYPPRVGYLNGPPIYFIGWRQAFDMPVERMGK